MKIIVAGGRNYRLSPEDIDKLNTIEDFSELISGGATGVDADAEIWADGNSIPVTTFKPDWKQYGRAAGPVRNKEMAQYADAVILFPGGKGTDSMHKEAVKAGITVHDYRNE